MASMTRFSEQPVNIGRVYTRLPEPMYYLNLPVRMPGTGFRLPESLVGLWALLDIARRYCSSNVQRDFEKDYYYVTAYKGRFIPPAIRSGWHCMGYRTQDLNFLYWTGFDMRFVSQLFTGVPKHHVYAKNFFDKKVKKENIYVTEKERLYIVTPHTVLSGPESCSTEETKQFLQISVSTEKYNLAGNTHNPLFEYDWSSYSRAEVLNDPERAQRSYY